MAKINVEANGPVEGSRSLLELTVYDVGGQRIDNKTYPVVNSPVGQETHEYDEQGNLLRTTVRDQKGSVLSRSDYSYEFDTAGNWVKMTTSLVVSESGRVRLEPVEVTYRTIVYYSGDNVEASQAAGERKTLSPAALANPGKDSFPNSEPVSRSSQRMSTTNTPAAVGVFAASVAEGGVVPLASDDAPSEAVNTEHLTDVGLLNDKALSLPSPAYPVNWRKAAAPLIVTVEVVVDETGRVIYARAAEGPVKLRRVAESAARQAGFLPFRAGGRPFKARGLLSYSFPFDPQ
ncbi:MAG TPA: hypothetical protein VGW12_20220 [Pyrinomonadaceae bacterium]|nr:hypothetical protein [Pyrinomonadaceae bacterium]